jgi:HK97 gp10 family phage protein
MLKTGVTLKINSVALDSIFRAAEKAVNNSAFDVAKEMKKSILSGSKSGRQYFIKGRRHQSSAPGQPPANSTGKLVRSIKVTKSNSGHEVKIDAEYAGYLEYGTSRMRPRPFILPALLKVKRNLLTKLKGLTR